MRHRLARWLRTLVRWLEPPASSRLESLMAFAMPLMAQQDLIEGRSGEAKRHQVLSALIKQGASESDAALAIELVVQASKGRAWVEA